MVFKKLILNVSLLISFIGTSNIIFSTKDEILNAINRKDHKALVYLINNYKLISNNKENYLNLVNKKLLEIEGNNKLSKFQKENLFILLKSLGYLTLAGVSLSAAKAAFNFDKINWTIFFSGSATFLGYQGLSSMVEAFIYSKNLDDYYKVLAIREELKKII